MTKEELKAYERGLKLGKLVGIRKGYTIFKKEELEFLESIDWKRVKGYKEGAIKIRKRIEELKVK